MKGLSAVGASDMSCLPLSAIIATDVGTDEMFWSFLSVLLSTPNSKEKCKKR